jgi:hypothetical protein
MTNGISKARPTRLWRSARIAWVAITTLTLALLLAGTPGRYAELIITADRRSLLSLGISANFYAAYLIGLSYLIVFTHNVIAAIIYHRRPDEWIALFVAFALVTNGAIIPLAFLPAPIFLNPTLWKFLIDIITWIGLFTSVTLLYLFPDDKFSPSWTRWLAVLWGIVIFFALYFPNSAISLEGWPRWVQLPLLLAFSISGVYAQMHRYENISTPTQRQQTKWALIGLIAAVFGPLVYFLASNALSPANAPAISNLLYQRVGATYFSFSVFNRLIVTTFVTAYLLLLPVSFAIAILRYRLWDIDFLIRRTLAYSALTVTLAVIYLVTVVLLQDIFDALTGETQPAIVTVLSTLAIGALFTPLRHRIQKSIDQRFYRQKYDAEKTLLAFSNSLREEVDLDTLSNRLLVVIETTMHPEHVLLWLKPSQDGQAIDKIAPQNDQL